MERVAVVLINTGGPDNKKAILPYLFNYYKDPQNLPLPPGLRTLGAFFTALVQRFTTMRESYRRLAFQSPLLQNTKAQAISLERVLNSIKLKDIHYRCYASMIYWHPFSDEVMDEIKSYKADRIILLPMFPQKSFKTTYAMVKDWLVTASQEKLGIKTQVIDKFYDSQGFVEGLCAQMSSSIYRISDKARRANLPKPRMIFIGRYHQPRFKKIGDPYEAELNETAAAVVKALGGEHDYRVCYQPAPTFSSTIGPTIFDVLKEAADDQVPALIVPISYVVEDPVTLIHMDQLYAEFAEKIGVPLYERAPTVSNQPDFMSALASKIINEESLIDVDIYDDSLKRKIIWNSENE